ncbi:MAG: Thioredoxin reductase [Candidatus Shapirobacteria bacterium GW2011_GWF1_38_23]|nr:MAG: Thioredoxin reductase [Candidatus Shapirobacteria bacterium GW2011_GWF2_37_20]KKQ64655.1 MAG: Thioredoxin reductase [Candidatus Shapirobacteria bacterium GW2011_GWF1_38_23]
MVENNQIYDTVIIGSGPAGLTAAIYNIRAELKTVVISGNVPGGQLTVTTIVDNWPGFPKGTGGVKLMMDMQQQVINLGVEIKNGNVVKIDSGNEKADFRFEIQLDNGEMLKTKAVIIATGAGARWLGLPNEKELIGRGISGCATCDGMFYRDKEVAIIGGGNVACEEADFLAKICKKVYLIHRRDELRASPTEAKRVLENQKIEKVWDSVVEEITGKEKVEAIKIKNIKTGEEKILPIDGLFVAIGRIPATDFVKSLIELKENGYIVTGNNQEYPSMTSVEGVFAAGDCMDESYRQAIVAAGAGSKAALDAERWLNSKE